MHPWAYMLSSIVFEVAGTTAMKFSEGLTRLTPSIAVVFFYLLSFGCFAIAVRRIDLSVAYAVWSGLGTAGIAAIGFFYFREPVTAIKLASILIIIVGVIGLNLTGDHA